MGTATAMFMERGEAGPGTYASGYDRGNHMMADPCLKTQHTNLLLSIII